METEKKSYSCKNEAEKWQNFRAKNEKRDRVRPSTLKEIVTLYVLFKIEETAPLLFNMSHYFLAHVHFYAGMEIRHVVF